MDEFIHTSSDMEDAFIDDDIRTSTNVEDNVIVEGIPATNIMTADVMDMNLLINPFQSQEPICHPSPPITHNINTMSSIDTKNHLESSNLMITIPDVDVDMVPEIYLPLAPVYDTTSQPTPPESFIMPTVHVSVRNLRPINEADMHDLEFNSQESPIESPDGNNSTSITEENVTVQKKVDNKLYGYDHEVSKFKCCWCSALFITQLKLVQHLWTHNDKLKSNRLVRKCPVYNCQKQFINNVFDLQMDVEMLGTHKKKLRCKENVINDLCVEVDHTFRSNLFLCPFCLAQSITNIYKMTSRWPHLNHHMVRGNDRAFPRSCVKSQGGNEYEHKKAFLCKIAVDIHAAYRQTDVHLFKSPLPRCAVYNHDTNEWIVVYYAGMSTDVNDWINFFKNASGEIEVDTEEDISSDEEDEVIMKPRTRMRVLESSDEEDGEVIMNDANDINAPVRPSISVDRCNDTDSVSDDSDFDDIPVLYRYKMLKF